MHESRAICRQGLRPSGYAASVHSGHEVTDTYAGLAATAPGKSFSTTPGGRKLSAPPGANDDDDDDD